MYELVMAVNLSELNIQSVNGNPSAICAVTDGECVIHITAVSEKNLEVKVDFHRKNLWSKSYSIGEMLRNNTVIYLTDIGEYYFISSGEASLRLYKNHIRIEHVTKDNKKVICEDKRLQMLKKAR